MSSDSRKLAGALCQASKCPCACHGKKDNTALCIQDRLQLCIFCPLPSVNVSGCSAMICVSAVQLAELDVTLETLNTLLQTEGAVPGAAAQAAS